MEGSVLELGLFAGTTPIALAPAAQADDARGVKEASVPFVDHGAVDDFHADDDRAAYLCANGFERRYTRLMALCADDPGRATGSGKLSKLMDIYQGHTVKI
jgi:hypothetical protein